MRHFQNQSRLLADSSGGKTSPPDHPRWKTSRRLTESRSTNIARFGVHWLADTVVGS